ncbi:MAG: carnitine dehydratase [Chloroflexi bacterium RBG_16_57_8]|nr:MAG: carnitine dehydratase [Chloroflexi bacterium RBG_16_57_8]
MPGPLTGIRVLDLSQLLLGPFATMLLCDMGAEVIKVERAEVGDVARGSGPVVRGVSTYFLSLNRGKKSVTIDLAGERGKEVFLGLVKKADILVENFTPGTMERLGLGYETLKQANPRLIYAAGSGFGQTGPYAQKPAFDITVQAMGGIMSITGEEGGPPVRPGVSYGDISAGLFLCIAILAALQERNTNGEGQLIDISMLDSQITVEENAFSRYLNVGEIPQALGTRHPAFTPFQIFQTADGYVALALKGGLEDQWPLFCALIGRVDFIDDLRFRDGFSRTEHYQGLEPVMSGAFRAKTTAEWLKELETAGIPCGPVNNIAQAASDPQVAARDMIVEVEQPGAGTFKVVNSPFKFSRTPTHADGHAPALGEHTEDVLSSLLGLSNEGIRKLKEAHAI